MKKRQGEEREALSGARTNQLPSNGPVQDNLDVELRYGRRLIKRSISAADRTCTSSVNI